MKNLETFLSDNSYLKDQIIKEEIKYKDGEVIEREVEYESGDFTFDLISSGSEDWDYLNATLCLNYIKKEEDSDTHLRSFYKNLCDSKDVSQAFGKTIIGIEISKVLKEFVNKLKAEDEDTSNK